MSFLSPSKQKIQCNSSSFDTSSTTSQEDGSDGFPASKLQRLFDANCLCRRSVQQKLSRIESGQLTIVDRSGARELGHVGDLDLTGTITVHDPRFYYYLILGGSLGAAEAYIRGYWDSLDLTAVMRVLACNANVLSRVEKGIPQMLQPLGSLVYRLHSNSRAGSQRNIAAHYDLSNDFFSLMLDPTMTYSSGIYPSPNSSLEEASTEKYDRICRKLNLCPTDHVLEIGTGWGGFAEHAVRHYGCRVTTTTISEQQHSYAAKRFAEAPLNDRITLLKKDYRDLSGKYDKLVSVEMIEAVGEKFLPGFFAKCSALLRPEGMMLLQAITIPDHRYDHYRKSLDFIQHYIFPGGFLPSMGKITSCLQQSTDLTFFQAEDFGPHYARTLKAWRNNFWNQINNVRSLGFDNRFIRTWHYYLSFCEAGFLERQIGVSQVLLTKPLCRRHALLASAEVQET
ncbi:MAG TPA: SAM-dependent methyltransferase [Planctomycetaceae bacterium]|nr:SAM-dependent methyltransferase [Planctomycetaceae bacterium]